MIRPKSWQKGQSLSCYWRDSYCPATAPNAAELSCVRTTSRLIVQQWQIKKWSQAWYHHPAFNYVSSYRSHHMGSGLVQYNIIHNLRVWCMWVGEYQRFRMLLISAQVILPMASFASGAEAVLPLAASEFWILPVPGNVAWKIKDWRKKSQERGFIPLGIPSNGRQISLKRRATRKKIKTSDRLQLTGIQQSSGVGMR